MTTYFVCATPYLEFCCLKNCRSNTAGASDDVYHVTCSDYVAGTLPPSYQWAIYPFPLLKRCGVTSAPPDAFILLDLTNLCTERLLIPVRHIMNRLASQVFLLFDYCWLALHGLRMCRTSVIGSMLTIVIHWHCMNNPAWAVCLQGESSKQWLEIRWPPA